MADPKPTREERLAAKLRENLRRRKAQSRAIDARSPNGQDSNSELPNGEGER